MEPVSVSVPGRELHEVGASVLFNLKTILRHSVQKVAVELMSHVAYSQLVKVAAAKESFSVVFVYVLRRLNS